MDERKIEILNAIINSYINSANPVGSRTLSKDFDLGISSATIRNEMADLEDLGYLNKPHTSAGRVPSVKAYRFFVDELQKQLIEDKRGVNNNLLDNLVESSENINDIFQNAVKILSNMSGYVSYLISIKRPDAKVKLVQLVLIDKQKVLLLVIGDNGVVEKHFITCNEEMSEGELEKINSVLNNYLVGVNLVEIERLNITLTGTMIQHSKFITDVIKTIANFNNEIEKIDFYYDGIKNILNFQEVIDKQQVIEIMNLLENKYLTEILDNYNDELTVIIGDENDVSYMKDNSVIVSSLNNLQKGISVKIGILGPVRMDYKSQIQTLRTVSESLAKAIDDMVR